MFRMDQQTRMVRFTSSKLEARGMQPTNGGEILKWVGVTLLATRYESGARADLSAMRACRRYMLSPAFGERTGMWRRRFDALWSSMTFSQQTGGADDASEKRRWQFIDYLITSINDHRASRGSPRDLMCVDEFMSKPCGQGGHRILRGWPMYVEIERKPENGCDTQCGMWTKQIYVSAERRHDGGAPPGGRYERRGRPAPRHCGAQEFGGPLRWHQAGCAR